MTSSAEPASEALQTWQLVLILLPLSVITLIIIAGNVLVITAVATQKFLQTLSNVFLVSLAITDLCVGIFILPLDMLQIAHGSWTFGITFCKFWSTADMTLCTISIFNICLIAWDRYRSVTDGVEYLKRKTMSITIWKIVGICFIALWISSPPLLGWSYPQSNPSSLSNNSISTMCILVNEKGFVLHSALGSLIAPTVFMVILYINIYKTIQRRLVERAKLQTIEQHHLSSIMDQDLSIIESDSSSNKRKTKQVIVTSCNNNDHNSNTTQDSQKTSINSNSSPEIEMPNKNVKCGFRLSVGVKKMPSRSTAHSIQIRNIIQQKIQFSLTKERRAAKILGIIMSSFIICWLPFSLMYMIEPFLPNEYKPSFPVSQFITWLGYINSALNPIIYTVFSLDFRKGFKRLLHIKS